VTGLLFSYGTLRQRDVQIATFDDLAAADEYEVSDYRRIEVPLRSGDHPWVYAFDDRAREERIRR
jgi:hypothetical protein